jgi:hypothetical protein
MTSDKPSAKSSLVKALKKFSDATPDLIDQLVSEQELRTGRSDRSVAILIAIQIDEALKRTLVRWLRPLNTKERDGLFGINRPLSNFSARIRLCHAMRVIGPDTRDELDIIREIRNAFAHSGREISFATKEIKDACNFLRSPFWFPSMRPRARRGRQIPGRRARDLYHAAAKNIITNLQIGEPPKACSEWDRIP